MTIESFDEIVSFIQENRGESSFMGQSSDDIRDYVIMALNTDTIIIHRDGSMNINGVLCWEIKKYIPLSIHISELIAKGKYVLTDMLTELSNLLPISFRLFANRKKASRFVEYKNPRRILKLLKQKNYGR